MGVINTGSFAKALWPGVSVWTGDNYTPWPKEFTDLFDEEKSTKAYDEDVHMSMFGLAEQVDEGGKTPYDEAKQAFITRYINKTYRKGFIVTMEAIQDAQYDLSALGKKKSVALRNSFNQTYEILGANVYNRAFTAGYVGGDGTVMCNSSHPKWAGGTFSNVPSVACDLSEAALEQACIDIEGFTDDRGNLIKVLPQSLHGPKELQFEAHRILNSILQPDTANNNVNALKAMNLFPGGFKINHYFTDTDAWFIRTNCPEGMKYKNRHALEFGMDNDTDTFNAKFYGYMRCSFGWTDPRGIYGSEGK